MINLAIEKIKTEMAANANNSYIQAVGTMLLDYNTEVTHEAAERILTEGKTISGSLAEMRKIAETKKVGNCAVLTDQEGFAIVLKYFGIELVAGVPPIPASRAVSRTVAVPVAVNAKEDKPSKFDVNLDDLLSGL